MSEHVVPVRIYLTIFLVLIVLTATTTAVAFVDLGRMSTVIMLAIAVTKATLVVLYFMHVRYSDRLTRLVVSGAFVWLVFLIGITVGDELARGLFR